MNTLGRDVEGVIVLEVSGLMTGVDHPGLMKEQVIGALAAGRRRIVINLSNLAYADSSFIGELVACRLAVARAGGILKVAGAVRRVQELLFMTRLSSLIESFDTEQAAVASFLKPGN